MSPIDRVGHRFGNLVVVSLASRRPTRWLCQCDCGGQTVVVGSHLVAGNIKGCGCGRGWNKTNLTNQRFGRLVALYADPDIRAGQRLAWWCRCDCGETKLIDGNNLRRGLTKSCGCMRNHGLTHTGEYQSWSSMRGRCADRNNPDYGGKGIKVCERWNDFRTFYADMGPKPSPSHSIDRKDSSGNYEPANCRWATRSEQNANRRPYHKRASGEGNDTIAS